MALGFQSNGDFVGGCSDADDGSIDLGGEKKCPYHNAGPDTQIILRKNGILPQAEFDKLRSEGKKLVKPSAPPPEALQEESASQLQCFCHLARKEICVCFNSSL